MALSGLGWRWLWIGVLALAAGCQSAGIRGVARYHEVQPGVLYRGAQPTAEGFEELHARGIRTVVDLREGSRTAERQIVTQLGMAYIHIPSNAARPSEEDMARCLSIILDPARQPVFVHCRQGRDRAGTAVAIYRVAAQGWSTEQAIREMREKQGVNSLFFPQIPAFLNRLDLQALRRQAVPATQPQLSVTGE